MSTQKIIIGTYLPVFNGFYNTIFESSGEECEIEEINTLREKKGLKEIGFEDCVFNYKEYNNEVAQGCTRAINEELKTILTGNIEIEFEALISPKFYNFSNDSINVNITLDSQAYNSMIDILKENKEEFSQYLKDNYTSYDGFTSNQSNEADAWLNSFALDRPEKQSHRLGSALNFILQVIEEYDTESLYNDLDGCYIYATNYDELLESE